MRPLLPSGPTGGTMLGLQQVPPNFPVPPTQIPTPPAGYPMNQQPQFFPAASPMSVFPQRPSYTYGLPAAPPGFQNYPAPGLMFPSQVMAGGPQQFGIPPNIRITQPTPPPAQQRGPTVYIGHLTSDTEDNIVRQLLSECGKVIRWSRTQDPATRKLSTFGFCEFESPLGVIRAVRCLEGLVLDGQELVANCEDKVKEGLEQWRKDRHHKLQEENPAKSTFEIEAEIEKEDQRIEQTIKRLALEFNQKTVLSEAGSAPEPEGLTKPPVPSEGFPSPPPATPKSSSQSIGNGIPSQRRTGMLDLIEGYKDIPTSGKLSYRENQRIHQWNSRLKESRAEFRKRVQAWERKEPLIFRDRKKRREMAELSIKDPCVFPSYQKKRLIDFDCNDEEYYIGPDGTLWEGRLNSRRQDERLIWIQDEMEADERDVQLEIEEIREEEIRRAEKEEERQQRLEEASFAAAAAAAAAAEAAAVEAAKVVISSPDKDVSLVESCPPDTQVPVKSSFKSLSLSFQSTQMSTKKSSEEDTKVSNVFNDVEDDGDIEHGHHKLTTVMDFHIDREQLQTEREEAERKQKLMAKITSKIPKTNEELFASTIDWDLLHQHGIFEQKVTPWISKKVTEFLGEAEPELSAFISTRVSQNPMPEPFLEELKDFLDEDAQGFVSKLWKLLIFECLRLTIQTD